LCQHAPVTRPPRTVHVALVDGDRVWVAPDGRLPSFVADLDRAVELAPLADLVFQTVTFHALGRGTEAGTGDFDGVVLALTRKVVEAVSPVPPT
jgi:hypothetical protein